MSENVSRRTFLGSSAVVGAAAVLGFKGLFGLAQSNDDDAGTILNLAATAETLACTHYYTALSQGSLSFNPGQGAYVKAALLAELAHLEFLNSNNAKTLADKFYMPQKVFSDLSVFWAYTELAENAFIAAYLAATRRFAELNQPLLSATAAQVAVIEGEHLALARQSAGKLPNNLTLPQATYFKVSEALPTFTSFLQGSKDFDTTPVPYPGAEAIRKVAGDVDVTAVRPFVDLSQFQSPQIGATLPATQSAPSTATAAATASAP